MKQIRIGGKMSNKTEKKINGTAPCGVVYDGFIFTPEMEKLADNPPEPNEYLKEAKKRYDIFIHKDSEKSINTEKAL
jgi:hypothetical protein